LGAASTLNASFTDLVARSGGSGAAGATGGLGAVGAMGAQGSNVDCAINLGEIQCAVSGTAHCSPFSNCILASFTPTIYSGGPAGGQGGNGGSGGTGGNGAGGWSVALVAPLDAGLPFLLSDGGTPGDVTLTLGASGIGSAPAPNGQAHVMVRY
jgi:hypothetical protein